jgi:hypothetical protein
MQERNDRKPKSREESDATSKETVADLEDNEKSSAGKQSERESNVQSPDGAFDEKKETDDAGPM